MQSFLKPNKRVRYGLDLEKVFVGQEIVSNYNITADESVLALWSGFVPTSSFSENSREFAGRLGFHQIFLPYGFLMNLTISLGAENYGSSSLSVSSLKNILYLSPAFPGDTFSCSIRIKEIIQKDDHNLLVADHILFNQTGEAVFSLESQMVFPAFDPRASILSSRQVIFDNHQFKEKILTRVRGVHIQNKVDNYVSGDLLLHPYVRPIGKSENLFWTTYFKDANHNHFNYQRFKPGEILVSDGISLGMVLSIAGREFRQILMPEVVHAFRIVPLVAEDRVGAFSFVNDVKPVMPGFEELEITTFGLRNVDTETELMDIEFAHSLSQTIETGEELEAVLDRDMPQLVGKVFCLAHWKVLRKTES